MSMLEPDRQFEALLDYLRRSRGFDFSGYKRPSLVRRVNRRLQMIHVESYADYVDYLEVHPEEFTHLFNTILINVTSFFRDPSAWECIREEALPQIIESKEPDEPIRVWCAGTSSGEEAYTLAILLAEALGEEAFRTRAKIYATDVDEEALTQARQAGYSAKDLATIPPPLVEKYFEQHNHRCVFRKDLRRVVIFGRHDLVQDAPISRVDLLTCRNTLMYFNAETQSRILTRFHFALNDGGFLFLGRAELLFTHSQLFTPVDLRRRIFTKVGTSSPRERFHAMATYNRGEAATQLAQHVRFREAALEGSPAAHLAVDLNGFVALANERARALFGLALRDLGRPLQDLELSYRITGLRAGIEQAQSERRPVSLTEVEWPTSAGDVRYLDLQIAPLLDANGTLLGVSITFTDATAHRRLQEEVERAHQELETAYEELQSTNEELETTNEELQSTVEELETTNEELQSTNEELETMNEELQSTNEELQTTNDEIRRRTDELNEVNAFLQAVLSSLRGGVAVVNRELDILIWNPRAEELWGLRADEVQHKNLLNLDIGLPVAQLRQPIWDCLAGEQDGHVTVVDATNRRGRAIRCRVTCTPLAVPPREPSGVLVQMEELDGAEALAA
jgi:two-component system, chemotaxis family, CheB/CheR fusion protein